MSDARVDALRQLLFSEGLGDVAVDVAGDAADIAAIQLPPSELERLRELSARIHEIGFRYVAIEWNEPEERA
jgi:hypothetical protein